MGHPPVVIEHTVLLLSGISRRLVPDNHQEPRYTVRYLSSRICIVSRNVRGAGRRDIILI